MKKFKISQIKYDTAGIQSQAEEMVSLPKAMTVYCNSEEEIADTVSDAMNDVLVESFVIDSVENC